jgi:cytochrome c oxidase subunit 3
MITVNNDSDIRSTSMTAKFGMWVFLFTEMLLFGGLFIVYSVYRFRNAEAFHLASRELSVVIGTANTIILLISSATIAMSITAVRLNNRKLALILTGTTVVLGLLFLVNKYFEWGGHIREHIYPGSATLALRGQGDVLFYGLYFFMTGLHALHIIIGITIIIVTMTFISGGRINSVRYSVLENGGLYWHLVDLIWIFLFPLFYLIT